MRRIRPGRGCPRNCKWRAERPRAATGRTGKARWSALTREPGDRPPRNCQRDAAGRGAPTDTPLGSGATRPGCRVAMAWANPGVEVPMSHLVRRFLMLATCGHDRGRHARGSRWIRRTVRVRAQPGLGRRRGDRHPDRPLVTRLPVGNVPHQVSVSDVVDKLVASNTADDTISIVDLPTLADAHLAPRPRAGAHGAQPRVACCSRSATSAPAPSRWSRSRRSARSPASTACSSRTI